jgi:hypothetical protein
MSVAADDPKTRVVLDVALAYHPGAVAREELHRELARQGHRATGEQLEAIISALVAAQRVAVAHECVVATRAAVRARRLER